MAETLCCQEAHKTATPVAIFFSRKKAEEKAKKQNNQIIFFGCPNTTMIDSTGKRIKEISRRKNKTKKKEKIS